MNECTPCVFPFTHGGITHTECTGGGFKPWCSTKTDENGVHVNENWGYCNLNKCIAECSSAPESRGDRNCDDENNNANCEYDGGDCCGENVDTSWCTQCLCLDPAYSTTSISTEQSTTP